MLCEGTGRLVGERGVRAWAAMGGGARLVRVGAQLGCNFERHAGLWGFQELEMEGRG